MSTPPNTYQYDPTGVDPDNLITNEIQVVTPPIDPTRANFIVPRAGPFFKDGFILRTGPAVTDPLLQEGVDYEFTHKHQEASLSLEKEVYGSINFLNRAYSGTVYETYQTIGGPYTLADYTIVENLTRSLYKLKVVTWGQIVGIPVAFPPPPHDHDNADLTGVCDFLTKMDQLIAAVLANGPNIGAIASTLANHLMGLASHTPSQVGLGLVPNWGPASQDDIDNRLPNKIVSPLQLYHAIARFNTSGVTVSDATNAWKGILRFATQPETDAGVLDNVAITPLQLFNFVDSIVQAIQTATEIKVGDPYFTTVPGRDPNTFLGYGTWVRYAEGKVLVGYDAANPRFNTLGATGGSETHTLNENELPVLNLEAEVPVVINNGGGNPTSPTGLTVDDQQFGIETLSLGSIGGGQAHENMPPYVVIAIWLRMT